MTTLFETTIPFTGFYESIHDHNIDMALEQSFDDSSGSPIDELVSRAYDLINWQSVHLAYVQTYVDIWKDKTGIDCKFIEIDSPSFYNYRTDEIIVTITDDEIKRIYSECDKPSLATLIKKRCTSYDGFISFYSPDITDWSIDPLEWESPQLALLIESFASETLSNDDYFYLMDDCQCNGEFDNWFFDSAKLSGKGKEFERLWSICDYLRQREDRKWRIAA